MTYPKADQAVIDAAAVRAYVALMWPQAMQSPVALAIREGCASDEANRAVSFARVQAECSNAEHRAALVDAAEWADRCLEARGGWTVDTLSHNLESNFGDELSVDECDDIAAAAIEKATK